jgi:hypothetical protein
MEICNRQQLHRNTLAWFGQYQGLCLSKASPGPLQSLSNKNWRGRRLGLAQYTLYRLFSPVSPLILSPGIKNQHTDYPDWPDMDEEEERKGYYKLFRDYWEKEIQHEHPVPDLPLFCLEDKYTQFSDYWKRRLRFLIEATSKEKVAQNVALVQFFPYHTKKYKTIPKRISTDYLASQQYNFHLVEKAIEREATIIMLRGKEQWCESVPLLTEYKNLSFTNSYLNTYLSKGNLKNFDEIVDKINAHIIAK